MARHERARPRPRVMRVTDPEKLLLLAAFRQLDRIGQDELVDVVARFATRHRNAAVWDALAMRSEQAESEALCSALEELMQRFLARRGRAAGSPQ